MEKDSSELTTESTETETQLVPPYKIILLDDNVTPQDFVSTVLYRFFVPTLKEARRIMLEAHNTGSALVAVMPLERAEFKVEKAHEYSRMYSYPLTFTIEPA